MRIKMRTTLAGPEFSAQAGDIIEVDTRLAKALIEDGNAEEHREVDVEYTTRFHGGLTAVKPAKVNVAVPPNPDYSQAREDQETGVIMDRRTADEIAADARLEAVGPVTSTGPAAAKSSDEREAEEIEAKVADAAGAKVDPKASAHEKLTTKDHGGSGKGRK